MYVQINVSRRIKGVIRLDGERMWASWRSYRDGKKVFNMVKSRLER